MASADQPNHIQSHAGTTPFKLNSTLSEFVTIQTKYEAGQRRSVSFSEGDKAGDLGQY